MTYAWVNLVSISPNKLRTYTRAELLAARRYNGNIPEEYDVSARAYGVNPVISIPGVPMSYVIAYENSAVWINVYRVLKIHPAASGQRVELELCALQTLIANTGTNDEPNAFERVYLTLSHYSQADATSGNGLTQNTAGEPVDGIYTTQNSMVNSVVWTYPNDYCCVVTFVQEPTGTSLTTGPRESPAPHSYVLLNSDRQLISGSTAFQWLQAMAERIGAQYNKVYRIQMVPRQIVNSLWTRENTTIILDQMPFAVGWLSSNVTAPLFTLNYTATSSNDKALGNPVYTVKYNGAELVRLPARVPNGSGRIYGYIVHAGATVNNGVNAWLRFTSTWQTQQITNVDLPVGEVSTVADAQTVYWQTNGQQAVSRAATGLAVSGLAIAGSAIAAAATGGAAAPFLISGAIGAAGGLVNSIASIAAGQKQADNTAYSVGKGAGVVNATDQRLGGLTVWLERYSDADVAQREQYFRRYGYTGIFYGGVELIKYPARYNYVSFRGTAEATIYAGYLSQIPYSRQEFNDRLNAELSEPCTCWRVNAALNYNTGNTTI